MASIPSLSRVMPPGVTDGVPGTPTARVSGNPSVSTVDTVKPPDNPRGPTVLEKGQETVWRGGSNLGVYDTLIAADRHAILNRGKELSGRDSGTPDPLLSGPVRPSLRLVNRTINYQQGTDNDAAQDDLTRPYNRTPDGRQFIGTQGQGWSQVYGGVPGLYQPYGSYAGFTAGPVKGIQSPVEQGSAGDGPGAVFSGPPHGLHSQSMRNGEQIAAFYASTPQMKSVRVDRPDNSRIAGQSYGQTVETQAQSGVRSVNSRFYTGTRAGSSRRKTTSWRGGS